MALMQIKVTTSHESQGAHRGRAADRRHTRQRRVAFGAMVQKNEKGHDFDLDTGACTRCGMTIKEYEDHGRPPCRANKGERSGRPVVRKRGDMG